jgi:hypothetical protein
MIMRRSDGWFGVSIVARTKLAAARNRRREVGKWKL